MAFEQKFKQQQSQIQKLAMTPELQQSIKMLQYNIEDLQQFINDKVMENPLIETVDDNQIIQAGESQYKVSLTTDGDNDYMNSVSSDEAQSLLDYLLDQIYLTMRQTPLRKVVLYLVDYVEQTGYFSANLDDLAEESGIPPIMLLDALTLIQRLDPPGVGARNLQENIMLQIDLDSSAPELAYVVIKDNFDDFVDRKWQHIAREYGVNISDIQEISDFVRTLSPNPGAGFGTPRIGKIYPDLVLKNINDELALFKVRGAQPEIVFQQKYFDDMSKGNDPEVTKYLADKKREYEWLVNGLRQRGDTILKVGQYILKYQAAFFADKTKPIKPLLLREVAAALDVHESTISRTVNDKYIETESGVYELKSFFGQVANKNKKNAEALSSKAIMLTMQELIDAEDKMKPLSDQKIVLQLMKQNIDISRRTVAKYRENLNVPSSSARKRYKD
ncbi:RNA polymerase factor sigma-54 [Dellaglioa algida]|uniref:RNA polymerase sigma-54 factor n=1 Tax=Dellaglioa algida TaxID=105612 RepID=A0A5C6MBZ0_9LACO|nr:RNA polymerase factor sigma-54 [Dellaglioa algida]MDK1716934.1 RNA polymerase factor sigma-54 [Dellaglioa algida]MDK1719708.1 RNA polymerase factor sigma-54 [Dellaglioa algida]MDK1721831.1 RNA polymerase factor sigma-54 [Dellaglioa algida]MDK1723051.1 RNA polymerase factor sigma-54 [Dellaglioa algida]MDK1724670.1 RNA polymerase factor sigma-54 [Dellaglioa algida]